MSEQPPRPTFRFAPSPNGRAASRPRLFGALMNARLAAETGGRLLLRIEDFDPTRCKREYEAAIVDDLTWLGVAFDGRAASPERTSARITRARFERLSARGLVYPCFCSARRNRRAAGRRAIPTARRCIRGSLPRALRDAKSRAPRRRRARRAPARHGARARRGAGRALAGANTARARRGAASSRPGRLGRLRVARQGQPGELSSGGGRRRRVAGRQRRRARPRSLRRDVGPPVAASAARLSTPPRYRHHRLVLDAKGAKMSKSASSRPLRALREAGYSASEVRAALGFEAPKSARLHVALQLTFAVTAGDADAALGACAINWSMRSRSRLNAASILPSNSRVRASLIAIGSTKLPLMMTS